MERDEIGFEDLENWGDDWNEEMTPVDEPVNPIIVSLLIPRRLCRSTQLSKSSIES